MGFPVGYAELIFPKIFIQALSFLGFLRKLIKTLFLYLGLPDFLEPGISWPEDAAAPPAPPHLHHHHRFPEFHSVSAVLIREFLPVVSFADLPEPPAADSCAVCLYEFEGGDEIRRLPNCRHIFHRGCLDRWMGYDQKTCPLCRTPVIPEEMQEVFNERLWASFGIPDFYGDYSAIPVL